MDEDQQLLHEYWQAGSQEAFRQMVERYIDFVYATAHRQVRDEHQAEDVTQAVFWLLARKARSVPSGRPVSAWLHKATCYVAANARRARAVRLRHEQKAWEMKADMQQIGDQPSDENQFQEFSPLLDEGLLRLGKKDRDAILMKFFEQKSHRQIAEALGISEPAATKRISRAVERLRGLFQRRGVTTASVLTITAALTSESARSAPIGLASTVSAGVSGHAAISAASLAKGAIIMAATGKLKIAAIAALVLLLIGGGVVAVKFISQEQTPVAPSAPAQSLRAAVVGSSLPVTFSDGTLVEVLGIQDDPPADPGRWWLPDGSVIPAPRFPNSGPMKAGGFGTRNIRFIIQMGAPAGDKNLKVVVTPRQSDGVSVTLDRGTYTMNLLVAIPNSSNTASLKIGLGIGPWTETVMYDAATARVTNADAVPVKVGTITEEKGRTVVQIAETPQPDPQRDEGIVLLLANGKRIAAGQVSRSFFSGATYTFDCPKDQMTQILFRSRPFEFIELKNVSLAPTEQPINVQIVKAGWPTTAP